MHRHNGDTVQSSSDTNRLIISSSDEEDSGNYTCLFNDASYSLMVAIRPTSAANMGQYNYHIVVDMIKMVNFFRCSLNSWSSGPYSCCHLYNNSDCNSHFLHQLSLL